MIRLKIMVRAVQMALREWCGPATALEPENLAIDPPVVRVRGRRG